MPPKRGGRRGWRDRDKENVNPGHSRIPATNKPYESFESRQPYDNLRYRLKRAPHLYGLRGIKETWDIAIKVLETNQDDARQKLLRKLIDDDGLLHVKQALDIRVNNFPTPREFAAPVGAFLQVITDEFFYKCISLDTDIGTLYHFISGANGARAMAFFSEVISCLSSLGPTRENLGLFSRLLHCLHELMCREPRAQMNTDLPNLVTLMKAFYGKAGDVEIGMKLAIDQKFALVERIIQRLAAQASGDETQKEQAADNVKRFAHVAEIEVPGTRHDNDKEDISKIQIVPTENEIRSSQGEFLPSTDFTEPHFLEGPERLLDVHFRLLRHDIFAAFKETMGQLIHVVENGLNMSTWANVVSQSQGAHVYTPANLVKTTFAKKTGLEFCISFKLPDRVVKMKKKDREEWWKRSKRLSGGTLLCLVLIRDRKVHAIPLVAEKNEFGRDGVSGLLTARPVLLTAQATRRLLTHIAQSFRDNDKNVIVEFPSVLPATFVPILENLQRMHRQGGLSFAQWLVPTPFTPDGVPKDWEILPPVYARKRGFYFEMGSILDTPGQSLKYIIGQNRDHVTQKLNAQSPLDEGQVSATMAALSQELCLIRGPPGTGKTFAGVQIMKVLIANKTRADLGPVIVVCYTNHALDQFLEHLMLQGITNVIRVGSRSSSTLLESCNLANLSRNTNKTRSENYIIAMSHKAQEDSERSVKSKLRTLHALGKCEWRAFDPFLRMRYPYIHRQFLKKDEEGWELQIKGDPFNLWIKDVKRDYGRPVPMSALNFLLNKAEQDVWAMTLQEKALLLSHFVKSLTDETVLDIIDDIKQDQRGKSEATNVYNEIDRRTLQAADIIGITTTGLAKKIPALQHVKAKVVVCEEAGEVLEAHMLSTMLPSVEHIIQIGDHEQLRPQIANFSLSMESSQGKLFQLDRSQFERLTLGERRIVVFFLERTKCTAQNAPRNCNSCQEHPLSPFDRRRQNQKLS